MDVVSKIQSLQAAKNYEAALALSAPLIATASPSETHLYLHALTLKGLGQTEAALTCQERAVKLYPKSRSAWHNLASTLGDLEQTAACIAAADKALALPPPAPETLLVKARAQVSAGAFEAASADYEAALRLRPHYADALRELSQLIWMQCGDIKAAEAPFLRAERHGPDPLVSVRKSRLYYYAQRTDLAYESLLPLARPDAPVGLLCQFIDYALELGKDAEALAVARHTQRRAPQDLLAIDALFSAMAAVGEIEDLMALAEYRQGLAPHDQMSYTLLSTAARLLGRPEHERLYDYKRFVAGYRLPVPEGWLSLEAFLYDLRQSLDRLHGLKAHPLDQSLRGGTQTHFNLLRSEDPVIRAFFATIDQPIRAHMAAIGTGDDPLTTRQTGDYRFHSAWSVKLRQNGFHVDHIHPEGWLSSAFYVDVPQATAEPLHRHGWIRFGHSRIRAFTPLPAEHWIKPEPGLLAIFPSYMWHGTEPFPTDETRMTIAMDIIPA